MTKKTVAKISHSDAGEVERLERLLLRLSEKISGYPYELALACRLSAYVEKRMAELANDVLRPLGLTYVVYSALVIIAGAEDGSMAPRDIAQLTGERPSNVTHICNELEERHLITRSYGSAEDRRRIAVAITSAGERLLAKAQPLMWEKWRLRFDDFNPPELNGVVARLRRQLKNLNQSDSG